MGGLMYISDLGLKISIWKFCLIMKTITHFALPFYVEYGMREKLPFASKSQFFVLIIYLFCVPLLIRLVRRFYRLVQFYLICNCGLYHTDRVKDVYFLSSFFLEKGKAFSALVAIDNFFLNLYSESSQYFYLLLCYSYIHENHKMLN